MDPCKVSVFDFPLRQCSCGGWASSVGSGTAAWGSFRMQCSSAAMRSSPRLASRFKSTAYCGPGEVACSPAQRLIAALQALSGSASGGSDALPPGGRIAFIHRWVRTAGLTLEEVLIFLQSSCTGPSCTAVSSCTGPSFVCSGSAQCSDPDVRQHCLVYEPGPLFGYFGSGHKFHLFVGPHSALMWPVLHVI